MELMKKANMLLTDVSFCVGYMQKKWLSLDPYLKKETETVDLEFILSSKEARFQFVSSQFHRERFHWKAVTGSELNFMLFSFSPLFAGGYH